MTSRILCQLRKEKKCKESPGICIWNNMTQKCEFENKIAAVSKNVNCIRMKEIGCKKKRDVCEWVNNNCIHKNIVSESNRDTAVKSNTIPINNNTSQTIHRKFINILESMKNRHCYYYNNEIQLSHSLIVDMESKYKQKYDSNYKPSTNSHIGQRKLLLSEIQLLTKYYTKFKKDPIVLYVGAAAGTHLVLLHKMFPKVKFVLYDGAKFDVILKKYPKIFKIFEGKNGFVTTDLINNIKDKYNSNELIFISDIRLGDEDSIKFEEGVTRDMDLQHKWVEILKPVMSLLKFRMPYNMKHGDYIKYMKGEILYGIWAKPMSGETRLLVEQRDINKKVNYNYETYEEIMFFHNKYKRPYCYNIPSKLEAIKKYIYEDNTYCPCHDCISELTVIYDYCMIMKKDFNDILKLFSNLMNHTKTISFQKKQNQKIPTMPLQKLNIDQLIL